MCFSNQPLFVLYKILHFPEFLQEIDSIMSFITAEFHTFLDSSFITWHDLTRIYMFLSSHYFLL